MADELDKRADELEKTDRSRLIRRRHLPRPYCCPAVRRHWL